MTKTEKKTTHSPGYEYAYKDAAQALSRIYMALAPEQKTKLAPWMNQAHDAVTNLYYSAKATEAK